MILTKDRADNDTVWIASRTYKIRMSLYIHLKPFFPLITCIILHSVAIPSAKDLESFFRAIKTKLLFV